MMIKNWFFLILFSLAAHLAFSQTENEELQLQIERTGENTSGDADLTDLTIALENARINKINLNQASASQLGQLQLLNSIQIANLSRHILLYGPLLSIYELQSISGFDLETIYSILPYVTLEENRFFDGQKFKQNISSAKHQLVLFGQQTFPLAIGYGSETDSSIQRKYPGSPLKTSVRYRYNNGTKWSAGITGEKDAGEKFFSGAQKYGYDFYSANVFASDIGKIKTIALGDYHVNFGQGLVAGTTFFLGKSADVVSVRRFAPGIRPYRSVNEFGFLRGAATTIQVNNIEFSVFVSRKKLDAGLATGSDSSNALDRLAAVSITGLHRTETEIAKKNVLGEWVTGGNISYKYKNLKLGATTLFAKYDAQITKSNQLYNQYAFTGNNLMVSGLDFSYNYRNASIFAEIASNDFSKNRAGILGGLVASIDPKVNISILYRKYGRSFHSPFSNAFAEGSSPQNEEGLFSGISISPSRKFSIHAFADAFSFDWLRFLTDAPSKGFDYFTSAVFQPNKILRMEFRFRSQNKEQNTPSNLSQMDYLTMQTRNNYRYHLSYAVSKELALKSRIEFSSFKANGISEKGVMMYQDISYNPMKKPLSLNLRFVMFRTEGYNSRIYAFENDVPFSFSIPQFSGTGTRFYLMASYHIRKGLDVWLRIANTTYPFESTIGSGNDKLNSNNRQDIKCVLRWSF